MTKVNIAEAKAHFLEIIQKALLGEEIIIAKGHKPLANPSLAAQILYHL